MSWNRKSVVCESDPCEKNARVLGFFISKVQTSYKISHPCQNRRDRVCERCTVFVTRDPCFGRGTAHVQCRGLCTCTVHILPFAFDDRWILSFIVVITLWWNKYMYRFVFQRHCDKYCEGFRGNNLFFWNSKQPWQWCPEIEIEFSECAVTNGLGNTQ